MTDLERTAVVEGIERITGEPPRLRWNADLQWVAEEGQGVGKCVAWAADPDVALLHLFSLVAVDAKERAVR